MPQLILDTVIKAPLPVVFDLARSIDLHMYSTKKTGEKAIGGVTAGLSRLLRDTVSPELVYKLTCVR